MPQPKPYHQGRCFYDEGYPEGMRDGWTACLEAITRQRERALRTDCSECKFYTPSKHTIGGETVWFCRLRNISTFAKSTCDAFDSRHPCDNSSPT